MEQELASLFREYSGHEVSGCVPITGSASDRKYFRLSGNGITAIGVLGDDIDENKAFLAIGRHLLSKGIRVPEIYAVSPCCRCYLQQDLGSLSLYDAVAEGRGKAASGKYPSRNTYSLEERALLTGTVASLPEIQIAGAEGFDFSCCHPVQSFDARSVMFDLNYFKYCFLKASGTGFDEYRLEKDFERLRDRLLSVGEYGFMYRDFQARNVMLHDGRPYFIDFQGGRRGPVHYDLASFVWQAKAAYPRDLKEEMISAYIGALRKFRPVDADSFREELRHFALFRTLQVLGTYGFRGYYERKRHFMESVPFAISNLRELIAVPFDGYPYLMDVLARLTGSYPERTLEVSDGKDAGSPVLTVEVTSFSYRKGIPADTSGNGGGYVFDCRSLANPGRYERYRNSTGRDADVVHFLSSEPEVADFLDCACRLADSHIAGFLGRGFTHLCISFGCTGGQHRSVFCAESLASHIADRFKDRITVILRHREQGIEEIFEKGVRK